MILLKLDVAAMMGYTGALFKDFFGGTWGILYASVMMTLWIVIPGWLAVRKFNRKDL
jgi:Cu-processing system permease protein